MRTIKYYDRINKQLLELEVSDKVAKALHADNRRLSRQGQKDSECIALSLDAVSHYDGEKALTYGELIEDENADVEKYAEKNEFSNIIWNVVDKLESKEADAIKMFYLYDRKAKVVARHLGLSRSAFTQFKDTALKHLHILLSYDEDFTKTTYYENHYKDFADDVINQAKEEICASETYSINLNNVFELMKSVTQINKITEKIGVEIPEATLKQLEYMTKPVWGFFKELKKNGKFDPDKQNFLHIPINEITKLINK